MAKRKPQSDGGTTMADYSDVLSVLQNFDEIGEDESSADAVERIINERNNCRERIARCDDFK